MKNANVKYARVGVVLAINSIGTPKKIIREGGCTRVDYF